MHTIVNHNGTEIEVIPTTSGFYCKGDFGETYIATTTEAAVFLAEKLIDLPEIYGTPKDE